MKRKDVEVQVWEWWLAELKNITKRVLAEEEKREARARASAEKKLGEYRSYSDLQDAYGCGVITERQFDRLADLLEKSKPEPSDLYLAKIDLLQELYSEQKRVLEDRKRFYAVHGGE